MLNKELIKLAKQFNFALLQKIEEPFIAEHGIELWIKRDDLIHPVISGNKWRKLKYLMDHALSSGAKKIISMGGAYSNHLHAMAYTGKLLGLQTTGIIRGEIPEDMNPTLSDISAWGMHLEFVSREEYREFRKYKNSDDLLAGKYDGYWIPEGGACETALKGVMELVDEIDIPFNTICVPCGTGATLSGIIRALPENTHALGFSSLKGGDFLNDDVSRLLSGRCHKAVTDWRVITDYHFGGFAKVKPELLTFIEEFEKNHGIVLDQVYTGKMMYGIYDLIKSGCLGSGQIIIAVHTGGLQGKRGFKNE